MPSRAAPKKPLIHLEKIGPVGGGRRASSRRLPAFANATIRSRIRLPRCGARSSSRDCSVLLPSSIGQDATLSRWRERFDSARERQRPKGPLQDWLPAAPLLEPPFGWQKCQRDVEADRRPVRSDRRCLPTPLPEMGPYKKRGSGRGVISFPRYPLARSLGASSAAMCQEKMMAQSG